MSLDVNIDRARVDIFVLRIGDFKNYPLSLYESLIHLIHNIDL